MDSRIISQNEFDVLFYEELTQNQLNHIFNIIFILSKYMLLTTEMLMQLYQANYNEKMGLSYLKRAVKEKLVVEYQYNLNEKSQQKVYYYALKSGIYNYLRQNRIPYLKMPPYAAYEEKSRILTFNQFIIAKGYVPNVKIPLDLKLRFFAAKPNIICYYPNLITEREIKLELENRKLDVNVLFMPIELARIDIGKHTRAVNPRDMD